MGRAAATRPHERPTDVSVQELWVVATSRPSPGFVRVTLRAEHGAAEFRDRGGDQWVRLFLPDRPTESRLPWGGAAGWYSRWQAIPEQQRPTVRNYTVREARRDAAGWDLDIDLVVHRSADGEVEGAAAAWALAVQPGDRVGLLEQGVLFRVDPERHPRLLVLADESGLPGVEAVLRSLPVGYPAEVALEVPDTDGRRTLPSSAELVVHWHVRAAAEPAGSRLLQHLEGVDLRSGYLYAVGEAGFTASVQAWARARELPEEDVDACAYWSRRRPAR